MTLRLAEVLDTVLDDRIKGIPGGTSPFPLRELGSHGWNVAAEDLPLPLLVLRQSALENNLDLMQRFCADHGVEHAPHGKTTMAPQLFQAQLDRGCWGITAATIEQLQVYLSFGVRRVMLANQVVGAPHLRYLAGQLAQDADLDVMVWVDSAEGVRVLADAARERPFDVCIEVGYRGGRTGVRDDAQLSSVTSAVRAAGGAVRLAGVAAFEGGLHNDRGTAGPNLTGGDQNDKPTAREFLRHVVEIAHELDRQGLLVDDWLLTAGGSTAFDAVTDVFCEAGAPLVVLRSGCYLTHDHDMNAKASPLSPGASSDADRLGGLQPALELWTYVQSLPEPGLAILTCGRRDAPDDYGLPVPLSRWTSDGPQPLSGEIFTMNDQHAYLRYQGELTIGDRVVLGISHPCRAFDKWRVVYVVDDDMGVVDGVLTYF